MTCVQSFLLRNESSGRNLKHALVWEYVVEIRYTKKHLGYVLRLAFCAILLLFSCVVRAGPVVPWLPQASIAEAEFPTGVTYSLNAEQKRRFNYIYQKGLHQLEMGQYRQAQPYLLKAILIDRDHAGARRAHARTLLTLGYLHWNRALVVRGLIDIRQAIWLAPTEPGQAELNALLRNLLRRMDRVANNRRAQKNE